MPGTNTAFGQMFDHELNPRKGWSGDRGVALEKALPIASASGAVVAGNVVQMTTANEFTLGGATVSTTTVGHPPLFAFQSESDFDVNPDLGNIAGGTLMAFCCIGGFELESTEIAATLDVSTQLFLYGDASGDLEAATIGTHEVCGVVSEHGSNSDGTFENEHGQDVVRFWTCWFPASLE